MIYVRDSLQSRIINDITGTNNLSDHIFVNISIPTSSKTLTIGTYYRHNERKKDNIVQFISQLDDHLSSKHLHNKHVIITGDMNIDLCKADVNNDIEMYFNTYLSNNFESHINKPTRIQYKPNSLMVQSATIIDHIFSNLYTFKCTAGNIYYPESDHFGNVLTVTNFFNQTLIKRKRIQKNGSPIFRRNLNNINHDDLYNDFDNIKWQETVCNDNINLNTASSNLINNLTDLCNTHAPLKKVSNRKTNYLYKPWINKPLLTLIRHKNKLFKIKKKHPTDDNILNFQKIRNKCNKMLKKNKNDYFTNYFQEHRKNSKKIWSGIRSALEWHKLKNSSITTIYNSNGDCLTDAKDISRSFAQYFEHIPSKCISKIPKGLGKPAFQSYIKGNYLNSMVSEPTDLLEVFNLINGLKNNSSPGPLMVFQTHLLFY